MMKNPYQNLSAIDAADCLYYLAMRYNAADYQRQYEIEKIIEEQADELTYSLMYSLKHLDELGKPDDIFKRLTRKFIVSSVYRIDTEINDPHYI